MLEEEHAPRNSGTSAKRVRQEDVDWRNVPEHFHPALMTNNDEECMFVRVEGELGQSQAGRIVVQPLSQLERTLEPDHKLTTRCQSGRVKPSSATGQL